MGEYRVEWAVEIEADDVEDAAKQAWGMLADATDRNAGASVLFVTDLDDGSGKAETVDMEIVLTPEGG